MSAKITVEKNQFIEHSAVYLAVEPLCTQVKVESETVVLEAKSGSLIPILTKLSKSNISYHLSYDKDEQTPIVNHTETKTKS